MRVVLKLKKQKDGKEYLASKSINNVAENASKEQILTLADGFHDLMDLEMPEVHKITTEVYTRG